MHFQLIKTQTPRVFYGDIPTDLLDNEAETYMFDWDDMLIMLEDFRTPINDLCDTLFDMGDVDYLPANKCTLIIPWLESRLDTCEGRLYDLYSKLLDYAQRAVELDTGVVVEL